MESITTQTEAFQTPAPKRKSYAVWEITLKCNLACNHCGSRAGDSRVNELTTAEAFDLVHQMAEAGITEVTLIGGEAFLRKDWLEIAGEIVSSGMTCTMTTGGYGINQHVADSMKAAGISLVSVSIDGMKKTHERLRGKIGSWKYALETMQHLQNAGITFGTNSQVNRLSASEFPLMYELLQQAGSKAWQVQMTVPMGNAADNSDLLLQPADLLVFHPLLALLAQQGYRDGFIIQPGNNFGYYGPYDQQLRSHGQRDQRWSFWRGCAAGLATIGIEADGTIKGCPSLPTAAYSGGNIRDHSLVEILTEKEELTFNLKAGTEQGTDHLWGFCKTCDYAELCRGACNWTAHVFFDRRGNNPYCHHRSLVNAAQGKREHLSMKRAANGMPFDNGEFAINEMDLHAPWPQDCAPLTVDDIQWPQSWQHQVPELKGWIKQEIEQNISRMEQALAVPA